MLFRRAVIAGALALAASSPLLGVCDDFRVVVEQRGPTGFVVRLTDIADRETLPPGPVILSITAQDGQFRPVREGTEAKWSATYRQMYLRSEPFPPFQVRANNQWWPDEVHLTAVVQPDGRPPVSGAPLKMGLRPPVLTGLALALLGALLWSGLKIEQAPRRDRKTILVAVGLGIAAGVVAFFAAQTKFIWQWVGFEASPLQPQSFFLLGLAVSAIGVRRLLEKLTGPQQEGAAVTVDAFRSEVMALLGGDVVRRPFREDVRAIIFDDSYVRRHPALIPRLEFALAAAKKDATIPDGLTDHVVPRLEPLYAGSYRRDHKIRMEGTIDVAGKAIVWKQTIHYEYIRNPAEAAGESEVKVTHVSGIVEAFRQEAPDHLKSFGPVIHSLRLMVREPAGAPLVYETQSGTTLLRAKDLPFSDAAPEISVDFSHDPAAHEVEAVLAFPLPAELRQAKQVSVDIEIRSTTPLEDGVAFFRVSRLTEGFTVELEFTPKLKLEIVAFNWRLPRGDKTAIIDRKAGSAYLTGWLLAGNGIGFSWSGTNQLGTGVQDRRKESPRGIHRVLQFLGWKKND